MTTDQNTAPDMDDACTFFGVNGFEYFDLAGGHDAFGVRLDGHFLTLGNADGVMSTARRGDALTLALCAGSASDPYDWDNVIEAATLTDWGEVIAAANQMIASIAGFSPIILRGDAEWREFVEDNAPEATFTDDDKAKARSPEGLRTGGGAAQAFLVRLLDPAEG